MKLDIHQDIEVGLYRGVCIFNKPDMYVEVH